MTKLTLLFLGAALAACAQPSDLNLMPWPASLQRGTGALSIDENFSVAVTGVSDERIGSAIARLRERLTRQTGILLPNPESKPGPATLVIHCASPGEAVQQNGEDESYKLVVESTGARLTAPNPLGILHGLETFLQLVEPGHDTGSWVVPAVTIDDRPRFPWRGLLIDVGRHFMPVNVIERNLDGMAAVKMNVLHLHLSDDQGFRVESKVFPKLQELGSNGLYYTQDQIRELIRYARDRGIRIEPEFDMPGHADSWLVGYPELASGPGPYRILTNWGVNNPCLDPTEETTYQFLDAFIGEMAALFPDPYFHIGGDEVNGKAWSQNQAIQTWMHAHNIADNHALQAYFNKRVQAIVSKYGKRMVGWDEILAPDLPKDIVIQSWRGQKSLADAAQQGYQGILSSGWYLDLMFPAAQHYAVDPMEGATANLNAAQRQFILGGESAEWSEYATPEIIDQRIWPRNAVIAERLWSPQNVKDVASMYRRMEAVSQLLDFVGLTHRSDYQVMLDRLAAGEPTGPLRTLADIVEPVKEYEREELQHNTQQTPLIRLIDTARPESETARRFGLLVDRMLATGNGRDQVREWLTLWRNNDAKLHPLLARSFLLQEVVPVSQNLSQVAGAGLAALDAIESGKPVTADWKTQQLGLIAAAGKPGPAAVLLMITGPVEKLVEAAANPGAGSAERHRPRGRQSASGGR